MAVHLPLSFEAQIEACTLMLSINNIFSPAHGGPIIAPNQDIVLGCYWTSLQRPGELGEGKTFSSRDEVWMSYSSDKIHIHARIKVQFPAGIEIRNQGDTVITDGKTLVETTPGRIMFNEILEEGMPFYNHDLDKKALSNIIADCHLLLDRDATLRLLDRLKETGFKAATRAGHVVRQGRHDHSAVARKQIIKKTAADVEKIHKAHARGIITEGERYLKVIDAWTHAREKIGEDMLNELRNDMRDGRLYVNPVYCMVMSKARGSVEQIRQLAGMRGLMAKPSGKIIEQPIKATSSKVCPSASQPFTICRRWRGGTQRIAQCPREEGRVARTDRFEVAAHADAVGVGAVDEIRIVEARPAQRVAREEAHADARARSGEGLLAPEGGVDRLACVLLRPDGREAGGAEGRGRRLDVPLAFEFRDLRRSREAHDRRLPPRQRCRTAQRTGRVEQP